MKFIILKLTAFAMLATASSVYASEDQDHSVQSLLRGSTSADDNCCGVSRGGSCPAGYKSLSGIGSVNGKQMCCRNTKVVSITGDLKKCGSSNRAPPKPKAQGSVPCIRRGRTLTCPNDNMDMSIDGSGCTCTPSSAVSRKPAFTPGPGSSKKCKVVTSAMNRAIGCMNVGDDKSTCEACGCRYVAFTRMCVP